MTVRIYTEGAQIVVIDAPPPPPPPPVDATIFTRAIADRMKTICAPGHRSSTDDYDRSQTVVELAGPTTLTARTLQNNAFGAALAVSLTIRQSPDPAVPTVTLATATTASGSSSVDFLVPSAAVTQLAEGWHWLSVTAPAPWQAVDYPCYVRKAAVAAPHTSMPVSVGSYALKHLAREPVPVIAQWTMVPAVYAPTLRPLPARVRTPFTTSPQRDQLYQEMLTIYRPEDDYRIAVTSKGIKTTANRQKYFFSDFADQVPKWPLLDGPRGHGCVICATSLRTSRRANSGKVHFTQPWRFGVIEEDGYVRTLFGQRHASLPDYWNGPQNLEFVGTWAASVPVAQRVPPWELWDICWIGATLATDPNAPPIGGEQPHAGAGPVALLADSKNGRVLDLQFSATDRTAPPVASIFVSGLVEPWNVEEVGGIVYVSDRVAGVVYAYNYATRALLWQVPVPGAAGLRYQDGFLYVGSKPDLALWKIDVATQAKTMALNLVGFVDGNSLFVNLAISDGSWSARGTKAIVDWSNKNQGYPTLFTPGGSEIGSWQFAGAARPGPTPWCGTGEEQALGYPSAVDIGQASLVWSTVQECVLRITKSLASDPTPPANYGAGARKYNLAGYSLTHSNRGFTLYGLPRPVSSDADINAYLTANGN